MNKYTHYSRYKLHRCVTFTISFNLYEDDVYIGFDDIDVESAQFFDNDDSIDDLDNFILAIADAKRARALLEDNPQFLTIDLDELLVNHEIRVLDKQTYKMLFMSNTRSQ